MNLLDLKSVLSHEVCGGIAKIERKRLYKIVRRYKPRIVVETGSGASTMCILLALRHNETRGQLISIDKPDLAKNEQRTIQKKFYIIRDLWNQLQVEYSDTWKIYDTDICKVLPGIVGRLSQIDMFFHDSMHTSGHFFYEYGVVSHKMRFGSILGMHDVGNECYREFESVFRSNPEFHSIGKVRNIEFWQKKR